MAGNGYQYGTSPRKIEPEYTFGKNKKEKNKKIEIEDKEQKAKLLKQQKHVYHRNIALIIGIFLVMLTISYRNSVINEEFNKIQSQKEELASIKKTNGQLEVSIESSLNLSTIEQEAKEKLGMQKLNNNQKIYVELPKKDYVEPNQKEDITQEEENWFQSMVNKILKK